MEYIVWFFEYIEHTVMVSTDCCAKSAQVESLSAHPTILCSHLRV